MLAYAVAMPLTVLREILGLPVEALMIGGPLLGVVFVCSLGGAQWLVLRRHLPRSGGWVLANAVAWPLGVAVPVIFIALVPDQSPPAAFFAAAVVSGVLMGLLVGAITGWMLVRLVGSSAPATQPISTTTRKP